MSSFPISTSLELCVEKRIVPIIDRVDEKMFHRVSDIITALLLRGSPDIIVLIMSSGGDVSSGLDIYDLIKNYPGKTTGIVYCGAASMATIILQGCDQRICALHAKILIHHISRNSVPFDILDDPTGNKFAQLRAAMRKQQQCLDNILVQRTGTSLREIRQECRRNRNLMSDEALKFGLVDRIATREDMAHWFPHDIVEN
jgi:ATP-dependent Clp protease protease subunit